MTFILCRCIMNYYESLERRVSILEAYILEGKRDQEVLNDFLGDDYYNKYLSIKNKISDPEYKDIYKLVKKDPNEVKDYIDNFKSSRDKRTASKEMGTRKVYEDSDWVVYHITNYNAAKYYGRDTKWCIAGNYEGHESRGEFYFNDYIKREGLDGGYYFYISKSDPHKKYCLLQRNDGRVLSIWDASDTSLDLNYEIEYLKLPKVPGVNLHDYRIDNFIASIGNEDVDGIRDFLENHDPDIDLNGLDALGSNAVEAAAETGNYQVVKMLLDAGLDPNVKCRNEYTALLVSVLDNEYEIEEMLLKNGADPDITNNNHGGVTPLFVAVRNAAESNDRKKIRSIELLLKYGADPDIQDESRHHTPIFVAARYGKLELVKILAENGADVNKPTKANKTPLDQAIKNGHTDVADYLRSIGGIYNNTFDS